MMTACAAVFTGERGLVVGRLYATRQTRPIREPEIVLLDRLGELRDWELQAYWQTDVYQRERDSLPLDLRQPDNAAIK